MKRTLAAGEGKHEYGSPFEDNLGVVQAFLERAAPGRTTVKENIRWASIRKYKSGGHAKAEERNVLGLALHASERGYEVLAFIRDQDGDANRTKQINAGIATARQMFPKLTIVGGTAVRTSDAWCLALQGKSSTENVKDPKTALKNNGVIDLEDRRTLIADADLNRIPKDAKSLNTWLSQARKL